MLIVKNKKIVPFLLAIWCFLSMACEKVEIYSLEDETYQIEQKEEIVVFDSDSLKVTLFKEMLGWHNMQGGAIYGDKLVCLMATDEMSDETCNGFVYNLSTGLKECDLFFDSVLDGKCFTKPHANQVSFGKDFYDSNSDFPLLYVSQVNGGSGYKDIYGERGVLVYNLKKVQNGHYTPVLVQVIMPDLEDKELMMKIGKYTPNYVVDTAKNQLLVMGYPQNSWFDLRGPQPFAIFDIPTLSEGSIIQLTYSDIVDSFQLDESISIQQSLILGRKVFSTGGWMKKGTLRIIDLDSKKQERLYNLFDFTFGEPQFWGIWKNRFLYYEAGTKGIMYEFHFKN